MAEVASTSAGVCAAAGAAALGADYVTFTSASAVKYFLEAAGPPGADQRIVSIGPVTSDEARKLGVPIEIEASESTIPSLVQAIMTHLGTSSARS